MTPWLEAVKVRLAAATPVEITTKLQEFKTHPLCTFERDWLKPVVGYFEGRAADNATDLQHAVQVIEAAERLATAAKAVREHEEAEGTIDSRIWESQADRLDAELDNCLTHYQAVRGEETG